MTGERGGVLDVHHLTSILEGGEGGRGGGTKLSDSYGNCSPSGSFAMCFKSKAVGGVAPIFK